MRQMPDLFNVHLDSFRRRNGGSLFAIRASLSAKLRKANRESRTANRELLLRPIGLLLGLILWFTTQGLAQRVYPIDTFRQVLTIQVDVAANRLIVLSAPAETGGRLHLGTPVIDRGDLALPYDLMPVKAREYYDLTLTVRRNNRDMLPAPENLTGAGRVANSSGRIRWINLLESYINVADTLELTVTAIFYGYPAIIDCTMVPCEKPVLKTQPFVIAGAAGAGLIGAGQLFRARSRDIYDNQYAPAKASDADQYYDKANSKHHTYLLLTYAGAAVLTADAVWWLIREIDTGRKRRLYRNYHESCCPAHTLDIRPSLQLPAGSNVAYTGLQVRIQF